MVVLEVYSKCLTIKYKAWLCSKATIFIFIITAITIIVPFLFAYYSRGFWLKHDTFYEQPKVNFRGEYLLNAVTNNLSSPILCNNFPNFQVFSTFDKCSLIKVRETDRNFDGKIDEFSFSINVDLEDTRLVLFYLVLTFDYSLNTMCSMKMQSALIIHYNFYQLKSSSIDIDGTLGLTQMEPLYCHPHRTNYKYNYSCIGNQLDTGSYDIKRIIKTYSKKNFTTHLTNHFATFGQKNSNTPFSINLKVQYPIHKIYYTPGFWQVIKWAWIQYVAIYIIFAWICKRIKTYIFENRLLLYYEISPLKNNR